MRGPSKSARAMAMRCFWPPLSVDPRSYWIYTNTPADNERVTAVVQEHGFEGGLDRLVASA